jgi:hypothetical protein
MAFGLPRSSTMEHRLHPRIPVRPLCQARFSVDSIPNRHIQVSNLGTEGCCIRVPATLAGTFKDNPVLEDWALTCPGLPKAKVRAQAVWCRPTAGDRPVDRPLEVGIKFLAMPEDYATELEDFIDYVLKAGIPPIDYSGMPA